MAWWILVQLGILALSIAASRYLTPDPKEEKAVGRAGFDRPRAIEGDAIPLAYGRVRIRSPKLVWFGDVVSQPIVVSGGVGGADVTIGYRYYVGIRFVLCRSNSAIDDIAGGALCTAVWLGDDEMVNAGLFTTYSGATVGVADSYCNVNVNLSHADAPGGGQGEHYFYRGRWDQDLYPADFGVDPIEDSSSTPRYRGQVMSSLRQWYCGEQPSVPPLSFEIINPISIPGYEAASGPIGSDQANPAAVIYDILTNEWGGVGSPVSAIDLDTFATVAQTLQDEQHGISLLIDQPTEARNVIEMVLRQIDGVLYEDPATRKYVLALIREDYTVGTLFVADESNVSGDPELSSSLWEETVNEVRVTWTSRQRGFTDAVSTAQDLASVNAQGGRRRSAEYGFPGVQSPTLAAHLATRELNFLARPIMKLRITLDRTALELRPGDPFVFQWAAWGLDAVFRVLGFEGGTLTDGKITITAVQDRFAIAGSLLPPDEEVNDDPPLIAKPIALRTITEAPRWIQQRAYDVGTIANVDAQHGYYLAAPTAPDSRYRVETDAAADAPARVFPGRFTLISDYARSAGPVDATGVQIQDVAGWTPASTTAALIASDGINLIQIDDEILAFETVSDLGGGDYLLDNVWRGVLDTVPADHAAGTLGYVLPGTAAVGALGGRVLTHGTTYEAISLAAAGSSWTVASESPADDLTARSRVRLPYPVDALTINGSQAPATMTDGGVTATFTRRDRLALSITKPDAATETVEAGTTYNLVGYKDAHPLAGGTQVVLSSGITSGTTVYPLGEVGHGTLEIGVDSALAVALPDGSTPTLGAWQVPTIEIDAPHHRNLIINGTFSNGAANWTVSAGTAYTGTGNLGGGGTAIRALAGTTVLTFYQDVPIQGYPPSDLRAWLEFAATPISGDTSDTFEVTMTSRDAAGSVLDTATISATAPTASDRYELEIANLDPDTATIRVSFTTTAVGESDTVASIEITEVRLHVGQISDQLLSNQEFSSGTTGWTVTGGGWANATATLYDCAQYIKPTDGASAQLQQDVTPAKGWERGAAAVLRFGRMNADADDTGTVSLIALDGGGSVIATSATSAEAITSSNVWERRYLALELPDATAQVRVQLDATRVTGTPLDACFGSFELRIHKSLDASVDLDFVATAYGAQALPRNRPEWVYAFPDVAPPNVAMYHGAAVGGLGTEPILEVVGDAALAGEFICDEGRRDERHRAECYDLSGGSVQVAPVGNSFLNFRSTEDWAVGVVYRCGAWGGNEAGLISRYNGTDRGWEFGLDSGGTPTAIVFGAGGSATATGTTLSDPGFGALRIAYIHHDESTDTLTVIDDGGTGTASTSSVGAFNTADPDQATFGTGTNFGAISGQIARIWAWRGTSTPTVADLQATITYATMPSELTDPDPRTGTVAVIDNSDATGLMVRTWPAGLLPHLLDEEAGRAIVSSPSVANLIDPDLTTWSLVAGGGSRTSGITDRATGLALGEEITSDSTHGLRSPTIALGAAGTRHFRVIYCAPDAAATFVLEDNSAGTVASQTLAQSATWTIAQFSLAWTGATSGNAKIRIAGSTTGTEHAIQVSPVMLASSSTVAPAPRLIPIGNPGTVCPSLTVAPTARYNAEGELLTTGAVYTDGTIARAWNTSTGNDNRQISYTSGGDIVGSHATDAAANTDATLTPSTTDTAVAYTARLRWAQAELRDGTSSVFSSLRVEQGASIEGATGRSATWNVSATALTRVDVGHDDGADIAAAAISRVRLRCREPRLV